MTPYVIFISIFSLIFLFLLIYLTSVIVYPKAPINYIKKRLNLNDIDTHTPLEDSNEDELFTYNNMTHKIYYLNKTPKTDTIIIDLPGGAFISSSNTFAQYKTIEQPHSIVSIEYPVLPDGYYDKTLDYIINAIKHILSRYGMYKKIILSAASAGCYYAVKIINTEIFKENIIKFISMSGYFGYSTMPNIGTFIAERVYLRQLKSDKIYDCTPIPSTIKSFYAVGANDEIKISTYAFLQLNGAENDVVEYPDVGHVFYLRYNDPKVQEFYKDVSEFITKI